MSSEVIKSRAQTSFILDPEFDAALSTTQSAIKSAFAPLCALVEDESICRSMEFAGIREMLVRYGMPTSSEDTRQRISRSILNKDGSLSDVLAA